MNKTVFVTGGTGFLGSYLLRELIQRGFTVRALKRSTSSMDLIKPVQDQVEWIEGDILDICLLEEAMQDIQQVYHCAAMVSFDPKKVRQMVEVNREGTANIVNVALDKGIEKLVYMSSIAAIGRTAKENNISEKSKWERSKYNTSYAVSKYQAEQEVWRGIAEGLTAAILNPAVIMGSGFWDQGSNLFFRRVWDGLPFYPIGNTSLVDVRDVVRMSIQLMESNIKSERFIVSGANRSYQSIFQDIAKVLGKRPPVIKMTAFWQTLAWTVEALRCFVTRSSPVVTRQTVRQTSRPFLYDNRKSIDTFDFQYTPIEQTIEATGQQMKEAAKNRWKAMYLPI